MAYSEEQKAALAKKRGQAAVQIQDPEARQQFIARQGQLDSKGGSESAYQDLDREADDTIATGGQNIKTSNKRRNTAFYGR